MARRLLLALLVLSTGLLISCSPDTGHIVTDPTASVPRGEGDFMDWIGWDWRIDRPQLIATYMLKNIEPHKPFEKYLEAATYDAKKDSIGLARFLTLTPAQQQDRIRKGEELRTKALRFRTLVWEVWRVNKELESAGVKTGSGIATCWNCPPPGGAGSAVTRALGFLVNATGVDPSNPWSWYDLSYMADAIGDRRICRKSLDGALAAIALQENDGSEDFTDLRLRIYLDYAWLLHGQGYYDECLTWVDRADAALIEYSPIPRPLRNESFLLRGLVLAETGDLLGSRAIAAHLRQIKVWQRSAVTYGDNLMQGGALSASAGGMSRSGGITYMFDKRAWSKRTSDFANSWIRAAAYLAIGNTEEPLRILGRPQIYTEYPESVNWRFWNGVGEIYERCGDHDNARLCYSMAAVFRPYFIYYPMMSAQGVRTVHGQEGTGRPFFTSYRHFYLGGSPFSYAANMELVFEIERDPQRKRLLADVALDALNSCRRRGIEPASALALRGRVHYFVGDPVQAEQDLLAAYDELQTSDGDVTDIALLMGLITFDREDYAASIGWLGDYVAERPDSGVGWLALGLAYHHGGNDEAALLALDQAVAVEPRSPSNWFNRGLVYYHAEQVSKARESLATAADLAPEDPDIAQMLELANEDAFRRVHLVPAPIDLHVSNEDSTLVAQIQNAPASDRIAEMHFNALERSGPWADLVDGNHQSLLPGLEAEYAGDASNNNRLRLAWCCLRLDEPGRARELLLPLWGQPMTLHELNLLIEADRALGDTTRALALITSLSGDPLVPVDDSGLKIDVRLWTMIAVVCFEHGLIDEGSGALERALQLDPHNSSLKMLQMQVTGGS